MQNIHRDPRYLLPADELITWKSLVESSFYNVYAGLPSDGISTICWTPPGAGATASASWDITGTPGEKYPPPTMPNTPRPTSPPTQTIPIPSTPSCCPADTFEKYFSGRYPDATAHLHLPAEKPYRAGQRRGPLQQHRTPDGRCPALQLYLHTPARNGRRK